jgi:TPR repeat protein
MTQAAGDPSAELARLLRRIDQLDGPQPTRLPAAPGLAEFGVSPATTQPLPDPIDRGRALVTQPEPETAPATASKSRTLLTITIATIVGATAAIAVILVLKMPPISIVVIRDGGGELRFPLQPAARNAPDANLRPPDPQRSVAPKQVDAAAQTNQVDAAAQSNLLAAARATGPEPTTQPRLLLAVAPYKIQRGQSWPLGQHVTMDGDGTVLVKGLAAGASLSVGEPSGAGGWQLSARDLKSAVIVPPSGFAGTMDLTIESRQSGAATDHLSLQLEWLGESTAAAPAPRVTIVPLEPGDVTRLLQRGEELLANRDIAAARAVFKRLADSGEARGAIALAETYEQSTLEKLGAMNLAPDQAMARSWYEKAKELGSTEAQKRLDALAAGSR